MELRNNLLFLFLILMIVACKSVDLPSIEESEKTIAFHKKNIEVTDRAIELRNIYFPKENDLTLNVSMVALNLILSKFASSRNDDVKIIFLPTKPIITEKKSVLRIEYSNYLNVDAGLVEMDLKNFSFQKFENNRLYAHIEIIGVGNIKLSGKYTGIPAGTSPDIELSLNESVSFKVNPTNLDYIVLEPYPQKIKLKTKFYVKVLEWKIPWEKDVPLELSDLLKPIYIPTALQPEVSFPLPKSTYDKDRNVEYHPYKLELSRTFISADKNKLIYRTNIDFRKK